MLLVLLHVVIGHHVVLDLLEVLRDPSVLGLVEVVGLLVDDLWR